MRMRQAARRREEENKLVTLDRRNGRAVISHGCSCVSLIVYLFLCQLECLPIYLPTYLPTYLSVCLHVLPSSKGTREGREVWTMFLRITTQNN